MLRFRLLLKPIHFALYVCFLGAVVFTCYRHPVPDDFDRYVYEAIVRGKSQPIDVVYNVVKHENPRAEASSVLDSPKHLRELEPLYAIRPLYLALISVLSAAMPIQSAISLISAASLFAIGVVVLLWTRRPLESALLIAAYPFLTLGRTGTPDALAAFLALSGLWLIEHKVPIAGLCILFLSLGVRTDNLLLLLCLLAWLAWEKRLPLYWSGALALLAVAIVFGINRWAGNYGWMVLFRYTFVGGSRNVADLPRVLSVTEYLSALVRGTMAIFSRVSVWLLLGMLAWMRRPSRLLLVTGLAALLHFLLFPSPEDRYLVWAYLVAGTALICSLGQGAMQPRPLTQR